MNKKLDKRIADVKQEMILIELEARRLRSQADGIQKQADQYDIELSFRANLLKELEALRG